MLFIIRPCSPSEHGHFFPGHLPEAHISLAQYTGLSTGLCATSSPPRGPRNPGKPGGKASSAAPHSSVLISLQRSLRPQARGPWGTGLVEPLFCLGLFPLVVAREKNRILL